MTPQQKIKHLILIRHEEFGDDPDTVEFAKGLDAAAVDEQYAALEDNEEHWDANEEVRGSGIETDLQCGWSRHYESNAVAAKYLDGSWVGWTYWFGGGKHGEPASIDWIGEAYDLNCSEEEKMVTVRTFSLAANSPTPNA